MTVGFVVSFFDFRNDVRKVIEILSKNHKIVVFYKPKDVEKVLNHKINNVEYRAILDSNRNLSNRIKEQLFLYFKKLPKSRNNYFLMELFKISNLKNEKAIRMAKFILRIQKFIPGVMNYDQLLKLLNPGNKTFINDINKFIVFSEVADDYFLSRLIKEKRKIKFYVYSWDHPFKHTRFPSYPEYFCWSYGIKNDLEEMQHISPSKIDVLGASQFGYVNEYYKRSEDLKRTFPFGYIYFGCALGINELVPEELKIVKKLAEETLKVNPNLKFVVRPYPVLNQWSLYDELRYIPNIVLDDSFRQKDLAIKEDQILEKFEKIHNAIAFLHLGTTMGLEACFTQTPSFIVDFEKKDKRALSLYSFVHQSQNEKYLIKNSVRNTFKSLEDYGNFLRSGDKLSYLDLNKKIQNQFPVIEFENFSNALVSDKLN